MLIQRASTFSNPVVVADLAALSEKVEVEGYCYREPQTLVIEPLTGIRTNGFSVLACRTKSPLKCSA